MEGIRKWTELGTPSSKSDQVVEKESSIYVSKIGMSCGKNPEIDRIGSHTYIYDSYIFFKITLLFFMLHQFDKILRLLL